MNRLIANLALAATVTALASGTSHAAKCSGKDILSNMPTESFEVVKDVSQMMLRSSSIITDDNAKSFYHNALGECQGVGIVTADGKFAGHGFCIRKDKDGDTWTISWKQELGADKGTWKRVAGTGKYANKGVNDSGEYAPLASDGTRTITGWTGNCE